MYLRRHVREKDFGISHRKTVSKGGCSAKAYQLDGHGTTMPSSVKGIRPFQLLPPNQDPCAEEAEVRGTLIWRDRRVAVDSAVWLAVALRCR